MGSFSLPCGHRKSENQDENHAAVTTTSISSAPPSSSSSTLTVGLISDIQYADCDDGTDFDGKEHRRFRHALDITGRAVQRFKGKSNLPYKGVDFMINLGDIIDGRNKRMGPVGEEHVALQRVLDRFEDIPHYDCIGNHELYCFDRPTLAKKLNCSVSPSTSFAPLTHGSRDIIKNALKECEEGEEQQQQQEQEKQQQEQEPQFYFSVVQNGWRFIILDTFDISVIGYPEGHPKLRAGREFLAEANPAFASLPYPSGGWFKDLPPERLRFVPFNGALGPDQLTWLERTLTGAEDDYRQLPCIVCTHAALLPEATPNQRGVAWNAEEVRAVLGRFPHVIAVFSGHSHTSAHAYDEYGIAHVTVPAALLSESYGIVHCEHNDESGTPEVHLEGVGDLPSVTLRRVEVSNATAEEDHHDTVDRKHQQALMKPLWT